MKRIISFIVPHLRKLVSKLESLTQVEDSPTGINSLAPKTITDEKGLSRIKIYLDSLDKALRSAGVNNIALTGGYGSGKSTILKTFQHQYGGYDYLNISLASFKDNKDQNNGTAQSDFERRLEVSILQQMFYHVKPSKIPDSRFKRIINLTWQRLFLQALAFLLWLVSAFVLFRFQLINKINPKTWIGNQTLDWTSLFLMAVFCSGIYFFIKAIIRLFSNSKINKLNIKGELELAEATDKSVFNQHLEEILYFFERTSYNVVIIEDVDRFESTDIFTKLREMNILINKAETIEREVKFIYAIKDDMFKDANERVKFFEFIIPVIPFINPSNANDQLTSLISSANLQGVLSQEFTNDVVTFIDDIDMRLLINIFHEYCLYRDSLSSDLDQDQLFAMIVYKNMFPDDFGKLPKRKGNLFKIISSKKTYIEEMKMSLYSSIQSIEEKVEQIKNEIDLPIRELRAVYVNKLIAKLPDYHSFYFGQEISNETVLDDVYFDQLKKSGNIAYSKVSRNYGSTYYFYSNENSGVAFSTIEKEVSSKWTYDEREQMVKSKANGSINKLLLEKEQLLARLGEIDSLSLQEIFEKVNIDQHLGGFKESYLVRSLLINGYLNENYEDYISLFHEINLSKEDFAFERKVKSGISSPFDYQLYKVDSLLKRLDLKYFKRDSTLNYNLVSALLDNRYRYPDKFSERFKQLSIDEERQFKFIMGYINTNPQNINLFIDQLVKHKKSLWKYITEKSGLSDQTRNVLLQLVFEYSSLNDVLSFEGRDSLVKYLEEMPDFMLFASGIKSDKLLKEFIKASNVKLTNIETADLQPNPLFEYIYDINAYTLTPKTIEACIKYYKPDEDLSRLSRCNYTTLSELDMPKLKNYVSDNFAHYIEKVVLRLPENTEESEEVLLEILNTDELDVDVKGKVLDTQSAFVTDINEVDDFAIQELVIQKNKMRPDWMNIFSYYDGLEEPSINQVLANYFNVDFVYASLSKSSLKKIGQRDEEYIKSFSQALIFNDKLEFKAYTALLKSIPYTYNRLDFSKLDEAKAMWMIDEQFVNLTKEIYQGLKVRFPRLPILLIEKHENLFIKKYKELELEAVDWIWILRSSKIQLKNKILLIKEFDDQLIVSNETIAKNVCELLPANEYVHMRYEPLAAMMKTAVAVNRRLALLTLQFEHLSDDQIRILTELLGEDYARIFKLQNKPTFNNDELHVSFAKKLQGRGLISSYDILAKTNELKIVAKYQ